MRFDIILPTIGRDSLHAALHSVFGQTYQDWRLYIIGDRFEIPFINEWPENVLPMYVEGPGDDFGAFARNAAITPNAEWIAYIDDDDEWLPHHLETLSKMIEANPDASMVRTAGQSFTMKHKHPRSSKLVRKLGPVNSTDILTVGMAHIPEVFGETDGWLPCDNHDHILWRQMILAGGKAVESDEVTFLFRR